MIDSLTSSLIDEISRYPESEVEVLFKSKKRFNVLQVNREEDRIVILLQEVKIDTP